MPDINGMKLTAQKNPLGAGWLTAAFSRIGDAVIASDEEGFVSFINPSAEKLTGWSQAEAVGQPLDAVLQVFEETNNESMEVADLRTVPRDFQSGWENSRHLISKQGTKRGIEQTAVPIQDDDGQSSGVVFIFREVPQTPTALAKAHDAPAQHMLNLLPVAVYTCEAPSGKITYHNPHAAYLWGREPQWDESDEKFCGSWKLWRPNGELLPHDETPMAIALAEGRSFHNESVVIEREDGSRIHVLVNIDPVRDAEGRVVGAINSFHDVSELNRIQAELEESERRKDEFLAMLAHELRNPLVPIRSGLDILALDETGDREMIQVMQDQVKHVVRLVDDLLDVSRIIQNKIALRRETVELQAVVKQSVEAVRYLMDSHGHEFVIDIPEEPVWLDVDPVRLVQVLENLLNNAAKYTEDHGRIELRAFLQNGEAVIQVKDSGIGIEPELLPSVFELFTQSNRSLDRSKGGLGIGLTLVQRLVEMHGGRAFVQSQGLGHGSTFTVGLPLAQAPSLAKRSDPNADQGRGRRIVVVDDNVGAATLLSRLLRMLGDHKVQMAHNGHAALELIEQSHPEIVLLDIGLPGKNGYQVAEAIRQRPEFDDVLMVALTGYGQKEDVEKSKEAGFDLHYVKPPSADQMKEILKHPKLSAGEQRPRREFASPAEAAVSQTASAPLPTSQASEQSEPIALALAVDARKLRHDLNNVAYVLSLVEEMVSNHGHDAKLMRQAGTALGNEVTRINQLIATLQSPGEGQVAS